MFLWVLQPLGSRDSWPCGQARSVLHLHPRWIWRSNVRLFAVVMLLMSVGLCHREVGSLNYSKY